MRYLPAAILAAIVMARIFVRTTPGARVDARVRAAFAGIESSNKWSAKVTMWVLHHPLVLIPVVLAVLLLGLLGYVSLTVK
jgi:branched-subunit amino acid transport protein